MANWSNTTLYIGFTSDLVRRVYEHREGLGSGFSKKYATTKLVYYESGGGRDGVLAREKELKKWNRFKKERLILSENPFWEDLYDRIV